MFDGKKHPVFVTNMAGDIQLFVTDPKVTQDFMTTKNKIINKDGIFGVLFKPILGDALVFSPRDENYVKTRKHISQAFYKNHNHDMQENLKRILSKRMGAWLEQIENSPDGRVNIDIAQVFLEIFSTNIILIACGGQNVADDLIECEMPVEKGSSEYVKKKYPLSKLIHYCSEELLNQFGARFNNPLNIFKEYTRKIIPFGKRQVTTDKNCQKIRDKIFEVVGKRIEENMKNPKNKDEFDYLNHLLSAKDVIPAAKNVVDEILGAFAAATETTNAAIITIVNYFIKNPKSL